MEYSIVGEYFFFSFLFLLRSPQLDKAIQSEINRNCIHPKVRVAVDTMKIAKMAVISLMRSSFKVIFFYMQSSVFISRMFQETHLCRLRYFNSKLCLPLKFKVLSNNVATRQTDLYKVALLRIGDVEMTMLHAKLSK